MGRPSSCCRLRSQRLTDRRESLASCRREEGRSVVKERGRRQSGGTISLSERGDNCDQDRKEEPLIPAQSSESHS